MKKIKVNSNFNDKKVSDVIFNYYPNLNPNQLFKAFRKRTSCAVYSRECQFLWRHFES